MGRKVSTKSGFQWAKGGPKPSALAKLLPEVREGALKKAMALTPELTRQIVERVKAGNLAKDGHVAPMPEYSKSYRAWLKRAGYGDNPDLSVTGGLLDHLAAKVKVTSVTTFEIIIAPYGRASNTAQFLYERAQANRPTSYVRPAYSYTNKNGTPVSVPSTTIAVSPPKPSKDNLRYQSKAPTYNAHLATYLSMRLGGGSWKPGGTPPSSFLTLTSNEKQEFTAQVYGAEVPVLNAILKDLAGN